MEFESATLEIADFEKEIPQSLKDAVTIIVKNNPLSLLENLGLHNMIIHSPELFTQILDQLAPADALKLAEHLFSVKENGWSGLLCLAFHASHDLIKVIRLAGHTPNFSDKLAATLAVTISGITLLQRVAKDIPLFIPEILACAITNRESLGVIKKTIKKITDAKLTELLEYSLPSYRQCVLL